MPGARIFLVEDDAVLCDLETRSHQVYVAADARTALIGLLTVSCDLVWCHGARRT